MKFLSRTTTVALTILTLTWCLGCNQANDTTSAKQVPAAESAYLLKTEPANPQSVKEARANAKATDEVTLVGRIGGDPNPWVEGQAAFMVVDSALKPCNEKDDDSCETPWDYCCDLDVLPANKALVKITDASGKTVATDARKLLGVNELQTVVVHGKAKLDDAGNLTVLADGVFVRK